MVIVEHGDEGLPLSPPPPPPPLPASPSLCPARFFQPTDEELLVHYLANKIHGRPLPSNHIIDGMDVYSMDPWHLMPAPSSSSAPMVAYFFTQRQRLSRSKVKRTAGSGTWKINGTDDVFSGGVVIGQKSTFAFQVNDGLRQSSGWVMHEFGLGHDDDINPVLDLVICRVKLNPQMEKRRKRGGDIGHPNPNKRRRSGEFLVAASPASSCIEVVDGSSTCTKSNMVDSSEVDPPLFSPPSETTALQELGQGQDPVLEEFLAASPGWIGNVLDSDDFPPVSSPESAVTTPQDLGEEQSKAYGDSFTACLIRCCMQETDVLKEDMLMPGSFGLGEKFPPWNPWVY